MCYAACAGLSRPACLPVSHQNATPCLRLTGMIPCRLFHACVQYSIEDWRLGWRFPYASGIKSQQVSPGLQAGGRNAASFLLPGRLAIGGLRLLPCNAIKALGPSPLPTTCDMRLCPCRAGHL
jgi:hypothetical protein